MSGPLRAGVIGVGFAGAAHVEAIGRTALAEVVAIAAGSDASAHAAAARLGVPHAYGDWRELVADPAIDVVHVCTPNDLHAPVGLAALAAERHLIMEKPLAADVDGARALAAAAAASRQVSVLCHNYREYPMVARAAELVRAGAIGTVHQVHGHYLQDGLCAPRAGAWRLDPARNGASITFADIGTHWCDLAAHLLGERIEAVCAQLGSLRGAGGEDHVGVLLRFAGGAIGTIVASQVSPGSKNGLAIQLDGSEGSLRWEQQAPEDLWLGRAAGPMELHRKTADELQGAAGPLAHLPAGHPEGYGSTFANLFRAAYRRILGTPLPGDEQVATIAEGLRLVRVIDAVRASAQARAWVEIEPG